MKSQAQYAAVTGIDSALLLLEKVFLPWRFPRYCFGSATTNSGWCVLVKMAMNARSFQSAKSLARISCGSACSEGEGDSAGYSNVLAEIV